MLGEILGAVGSIAGGLLGNSAAKKANKQQQANRKEDIALQREFAQNSIQWKANDAKAAGISKLAALGAPTTSYAPNNVGSTSMDYSFLGNAGQNIGRAMAAGAGPGGGSTAVNKATTALQLEGLSLDNEFKRTQIASLQKNFTQAGTPPPYTVEGPLLNLKTNRDISDQNTPFSVPGSGPDQTLTRTNSGALTWDTPPQLAESRESDPWYKNAINFYRNGILPFAQPLTRVPQEVINETPSGHTPFFNPVTQEWQYVRHRGRHSAMSFGFKRR